MANDEMPRLGATGKFPEGKLTPDDEGELQFAIHNHKGNVVIQFGKEVAWLAMPPELARMVAGALVKEADKLDGGGA